MKKIGIFYGSSTGTTQKVAQKIGVKLNVNPDDIHDVSTTSPSALGEYEVLLFGSSTWGAGELQRDWIDFTAALKSLNLEGKKVAVFGCGRERMANTFCNAVGILYDIAKETGAELFGEFNSDGYTFKKSKAMIENNTLMKGLVLDQDNHPELTDKKITQWCEIISSVI